MRADDVLFDCMWSVRNVEMSEIQGDEGKLYRIDWQVSSLSGTKRPPSTFPFQAVGLVISGFDRRLGFD